MNEAVFSARVYVISGISLVIYSVLLFSESVTKCWNNVIMKNDDQSPLNKRRNKARNKMSPL